MRVDHGALAHLTAEAIPDWKDMDPEELERKVTLHLYDMLGDDLMPTNQKELRELVDDTIANLWAVQ